MEGRGQELEILRAVIYSNLLLWPDQRRYLVFKNTFSDLTRAQRWQVLKDWETLSIRDGNHDKTKVVMGLADQLFLDDEEVGGNGGLLPRNDARDEVTNTCASFTSDQSQSFGLDTTIASPQAATGVGSNRSSQYEVGNSTSGLQQEAISDPIKHLHSSHGNREPALIVDKPSFGGAASASVATGSQTSRKRPCEYNPTTLLESILRQLSISQEHWTTMSKDHIIIKFNDSLAGSDETWQSLMLASLAIKFPGQFNSLSTSEDEWLYALAEAVSEKSFLDIAVRSRLANVLAVNQSEAKHQDGPDARTLLQKILFNEDIIMDADMRDAVNVELGNDKEFGIIEGLAYRALEEYEYRRGRMIFKKVKRDTT